MPGSVGRPGFSCLQAGVRGGDDSRAGFTAFRYATFPRFSGLFQSSVAWQEDTRPGRSDQGRNVLTVEIGESYADRALECAESTVREMAAESVLDLGEVDVLVATASVSGFAAAMAQRLGVPAARVAMPSQALAGAHTAALAVALQSVPLEAGRTTLFVCVGAGITVVAALYRG